MISYNFGTTESLADKINDELNYINRQKNIQNKKNSSLLNDISNFSNYHNISIDKSQDLHKFKLKLLSKNFSYLNELETKLIEIKNNLEHNNNMLCEIIKTNLKEYDSLFLNYQMKILNNNIKLDSDVFININNIDNPNITNNVINKSDTSNSVETTNTNITTFQNNLENTVELKENLSKNNSSKQDLTTNIPIQEVKDDNYRKIFKLVVNEENNATTTFEQNLTDINEQNLQNQAKIIDSNTTSSTSSNNNLDYNQNFSLFNIVNSTKNSKLSNDALFNNLSDNKTLLISEKDNKIYLPYTVKEIKYLWYENNSTCTNIEEIIDKFYTIPLTKHKNFTLSRFKESMNLMLHKEYSSFLEALEFAFEMSIKSKLNPAVIAACKNIDELNEYLDCMKSNNLESYPYFEIKYDVNPS